MRSLFEQVPASLRFVLEGEMPPYLLAKDLILQIIGEVRRRGAPHHAHYQPARRSCYRSWIDDEDGRAALFESRLKRSSSSEGARVCL